MRKIYLEDVPLNKNGTVAWRDCVGLNVRFEYDDVSGIIEIIDYLFENKNVSLLCKYRDKEKWVSAGHLKKGNIGTLIGKVNLDYVYNIDDVAHSQFVILNRFYQDRNKKSKQQIKWYTVKCLKCGCSFDVTETALECYHNCQACCDMPKKLFVGFNDLETKYPEIAKMLKNPEKAKTYIYNSTAREDWICPICGEEILDKSIDYVLHRGLKCPHCSDKHLSFPERVMYELLRLLNVKFKIHMKFDWSNDREYDFYLYDFNYIVETHGGQHYFKHGKWLKTRSLEEEQENDKYKKEIACINGIQKYIVIDCRFSDFDYIYNNIQNSDICKLFNLDKIDKDILFVNVISNKTKFISDLWNNGLKTYEELIEETKLSSYIIRQYLKDAARLGWCDYTNKAMKQYKKENKLLGSNNKIKVRCVNDDMIFQSIVDAAKYYNTSPQTVKRSCAENKIKNINGRELKFEFASETNQNNTTT